MVIGQLIKFKNNNNRVGCVIIPSGSELGFYTCDDDSNVIHTVYYEVIPETVGQYTGLTDKNIKKIFEGDICKDSLNFVFAVKWDEKNSRFLGYTSKQKLIYVGKEPKVEVIGNIYDNPKLLEATE